ncbi:MAG: ATP synthase F0 subunit C [Deltaproteobacteria bacterium]|nr:ATP synthase F0 subunit C [Deltaproteobacteria bacterium]
MRFATILSLLTMALLLAVEPAFAEQTEAAAATNWGTVGVAIAMAIASSFGALAQCRAGAAALDSIGRNPGAAGSLFVPMILVLALIESLVALTFVIILIK